MTPPLIVRALMSSDWDAAFRLVWTETFKAAAADMGLTAVPVDVVLGDLVSWDDRRRACMFMGQRCANDYALPDLASAWLMLGADPAGPEWRRAGAGKVYEQIFVAISKAIVADASLLNDERFREAIQGWQLFERGGSDGDQDLIVSALRYGAMMRADREDLMQWARFWSEVKP